MMARMTHARIVNFFQTKGAKFHFNYFYLNKDLPERQYVRCGIVEYADLERDLRYWETLMGSTMMQRPVKTLIKDEAIWDAQQENLKSAVSGVLVTYSVCIGCFDNSKQLLRVHVLSEHC